MNWPKSKPKFNFIGRSQSRSQRLRRSLTKYINKIDQSLLTKIRSKNYYLLSYNQSQVRPLLTNTFLYCKDNLSWYYIVTDHLLWIFSSFAATIKILLLSRRFITFIKTNIIRAFFRGLLKSRNDIINTSRKAVIWTKYNETFHKLII